MNAEEQTTNNGILLLDIGNTNLKWAWLLNGEIGSIVTVAHAGRDTGALATEEWFNGNTPGQVYISSVASQELEASLTHWCNQNWDIEPVFIHSTAEACGVINSYSEPERLGVDRWLSMIALQAKMPGPVCVVDCGTAVTIDVIGLDGQHLGGLILPGFGMMLQSLTENTSIAFDSAVASNGFLATDTETAVAAGGVLAVAALVEQVQQEVAAEYSIQIDLVLTGGDAEILYKALRVPSVIKTDLVLQGLVEIIKDGAD
jgi:type III pantothenate kinase